MRFLSIVALGSCLLFGCGEDVATGDVEMLEPGEMGWSRSLDIGEAYDVAVDASGAIYVTGIRGTSEEPELWLGKFDASGEPVWAFVDSGTIGTAVAVAGDGVYVAGHRFDSSDAGNRVHRLGLDGVHEWRRDTASAVWGLGARNDGDVYAVGDRLTGMEMLRIEKNGEVAWSHLEGVRVGDAGPSAMAVSASGELLVASSDATMWVHARAADGMELWTREIATDLRTIGFHSVAGRADGTISVIGMVQEAGARAYAAELTADGEVLGVRTLERPVLEHVVDGEDLLLGSFAVVERQTQSGEVLWSIDTHYCRTYNLALGSGDALVLLQSMCDEKPALKVVGR